MKYILSFLLLSLCSCGKDWLLVKQDKSLVVPTTLEDMQALMDEDVPLTTANSHLANLAEIGTDNFFLEDAGFQRSREVFKNTYTFAQAFSSGEEYEEYYGVPYKRVFYANVVLEGLKKINPTPSQQLAYDNARGCALFVRAYSFFWLSQLFAAPYNAETATNALGIPLRLTADINGSTPRSSIQQTYDQILADASEAAALLPEHSLYKTRPSKAAAYALLARTCLSKRDYPAAGLYADSSLNLESVLLDFKTLDPAPIYPIAREVSYATEVLYSDLVTANFFQRSTTRIDTVFYASYSDNDLRKSIFFKLRPETTYYTFNGSYEGSGRLFVGLSSNEMFLTRSECLARAGNAAEAMDVLNTLLTNRWDSSFVPLTALDAADALEQILLERRKELCFRGLRWMDLRRLNLEQQGITVTHQVMGSTYTLSPNSNLYLLPFPLEVIKLSGIEQNPR